MKSVGRAVFIVFFASPLFAQNPHPSGNVYGSIHDEQGGVLRGVTVTLSGPGAPQFMESDAQGDFHFLYLDPGSYSLILDLPQFAELRRDDIQVSLGRDLNFALTMRISGAKEAVTVSSEAPLVDTRKTQAGAIFEQKELESIPTSRDIWAIAQQVPGVLIDDVNVGGNKSTQQPSFVGKGSHSDQNSYSLDGIDITDPAHGATPIYFDFDSMREVQITSGGSDPEISAPGVAINVVTKRGTDALKGSARFLYTPGSWQSSNTPDEAKRAGFVTDGILYLRDYGAEMGGPLVKDHVWLWGAGSRVDSNESKTSQILANGKIPSEHTTLENWIGKIDAQPTAADSLTLLGSHFVFQLNGEFLGPLNPPETTEDKSIPTTTWKVEDSRVFSPSFVASAYFSNVQGRFTYSPEGGAGTDVSIDTQEVQHGSNFLLDAHNRDRQAGVSSSSFFNTGDVSHELKFGFGYNHAVSSSASSWPGSGNVADEFDGSAWITREASNSIELDYLDAYLSDVLTTGRFTLNAGVRFDYQRGKNLPSSVAANPEFPDLLPAVHYAGDSGYPITWKNLEPRVSATYALDRERKTLLRASYAQFADRLRNEILSLNAFPAISYLYYSWTDSNGNHKVDRGELGALYSWSNVDPNNPGLTASPNKLAGNLKAPTTDEFILGLDRQLLPDLATSVSYTYRNYRNTVFQNPEGVTASDYTFGGDAAGTAVASNGFTLPFDEPYYAFQGTFPGGAEILNRPDYHETYQGAEIQVVKRMSHGWMLRGSFAYNDWRRHVPPDAVFNPNNLVGGSNEDGGTLSQQSNKPGRNGLVFIGAKWQFNLGGLYQLPAGIQASLNLFGRQGYIVPYSVTVKTHDSAGSRPDLQIGAADSHRLDDVYELDAGLSKVVQLGPLSVTGSLECFNVLNRNTVLQRVANAGVYDSKGQVPFQQNRTFNQIAEVQSPRIFRVGVRVGF